MKQIVGNENGKAKDQDFHQEPSSPRTRLASQTYYGTEKQVVRDGIKIKEIEITGEKSTEPIDMKKQKKLSRKNSIDKEELNVPCRDLGRADHEGWLYKKAGGHGIVPVSWKKFWVVIKLGKLYCYKTSFNIAADYLLNIRDYTVEHASEKKKAFAFLLKPNEEDKKLAVFAGETEEEVNRWIEDMNKILSGIDLSTSENNLVPDYEERSKSFSTHKPKEDTHARKRPPSAFMDAENETTGMPAGFGARTSSTSQLRVRKISGNQNPSSILSVGSMFHTLDEGQDADTSTTEDLNGLLYKEVTIETEVAAEEVYEPGTPAEQPDEPQQPNIPPPASTVEIEKPKDVVVVNGNVDINVPDVQKSEELKQEVAPKSIVSEEVVQLEVKDDSRDKKSTSQLFKELSTEEDAESVIRQLEQDAVKDVDAPAAPVVVQSPVSAQPAEEKKTAEEEKPEIEEKETPEIPVPAEEKVRPPPVEEEIVAPTLKVDVPVAHAIEAVTTPTEEVKQPEAPRAVPEYAESVETPTETPVEVSTEVVEETTDTVEASEGQQPGVVTIIETITITQTEDGETESIVTETREVDGEVDDAEGVEVSKPKVEPIVISADDNRDSVASDSSDYKPALDLSPTATETNVDLGDDLDIPNLDNGDSSLIDDITMELSASKEQSSSLNNGTVIAAV